jgi:hypothetical protein
LARPVRLTLGGLTAALESVVEEGKLSSGRPDMCGRRLIFEAAIGGEAELRVGVRPEEVDQALEGWGRVVQDQAGVGGLQRAGDEYAGSGDVDELEPG